MFVETVDLVTPSNAAYLAGVGLTRLTELQQQGHIKPFVTIDGLKFFHKAEVLALRHFLDTLAGRKPSRPLPRTQELF
ncbi:MAG: hypothetical protein JWM80_3746 [Cyanobacteria bacterium RYN_339]|nr:hypothetical protein [Cyanobacteria bacterium RYN_339]